jgi:hypothetical protein
VIVLHANWTGSRLWLWAEAVEAVVSMAALGETAEADQEQRRGGTPGQESALHPAAADTRSIVAGLAAAFGDKPLPNTLIEGAIDLRLPAVDGVPLPSSRLSHLTGHSATPLESESQPELRRTTVPAIGIPVQDVDDVLVHLEDAFGSELDADPEDEQPVLGPTVRYLASASRLALHLLAQQRFVPALRQEPSGELHGLWQPWLSDERTAQRVALLLRGMPPAARAAVDEFGHQAWPILEDFLASFLDAQCRGVLLHEGMGESISERSADADPQVAWLAGLLGEGDAVPAAGSMRTDMVKNVRRWIAGLEDRGLSSAWRLLLRLTEPDNAALLTDLEDPGDNIYWTLSFHLQSQEYPSLVVDASDVWVLPTDSITLEGRRLDNPHELLLAELGRASRLYPALEQALGDSEPTSLELSTRRAYQFLREMRPVMHEQGFGVEVPEWWDLPTARLGARLKLTSDALELITGEGGLSPTNPAGARLGLKALVGYSWDISIGGVTLSLQEFERLAERRTPLVRINGRWVEVRTDDVRAAIRFIQENPGGEMQVGDAIRLAYSTDSRMGGLSGIPIVGVEASGWVSMLFGLDGGDDGESGRQQIPIITPPAGFHGSLRPYQIRGVSWLAFLERFGFGPCLADDMGLGKTIQLLALLAHEREEAARKRNPELPAQGAAAPAEPQTALSNAQIAEQGWSALTDEVLAEVAASEATESAVPPTLLVVPMSVVGNWIHEIRRFCPDLKTLVHHGMERLQGERFVTAARRADAVITTYALAHRDRELLGQVQWQRVVLDEAQYIKNPGTKQSLAVRSLNSGTRIALTGTPVENRLTELWSILDFLNPGYLGTAATFRKRFAIPVERYHDAHRARQLRELVRPFVLRRLKTEPGVAADLPEKLEMREYCHLTPEQATLYESLVQRMLSEVESAEGMQRRGLVLSTLVKLKQICNHPAQYLKESAGTRGTPTSALTAAVDDDEGEEDAADAAGVHAGSAAGVNYHSPARSGKCVRLLELLQQVLAAGDQALVFTQFRQMGDILAGMLRHELGREVLFFHGGTPQPQRVQMVDRFQKADGTAPILIVSLKAGGVGLNLTAATHVFHFDRWWNPAVENQATDRAHRIGQYRTVQVHKFVVSGTLEERIDAMIEQKTELATNIIGSGEQYLTEMSTDELRDILTLRREAVGDEDE